MNGRTTRASDTRRRVTPASNGVLEGIITGIGVALVAGAIATNQHWLDRHFLPSFFLPRHWYVQIETTVRVAGAAVGVLLIAVRRHLAATLVRARVTIAWSVLAAIVALAASDLVLGDVRPQPKEWLAPQEEPLRVVDSRLGWVLAAGRTGYNTIGGRRIAYAIDAAGERVRQVDQPVDPERPTILFAGESVMFGEGLRWDETIPAQVESMLGIQSANLAVHGYGNDQAYLRLRQALPRFRHPVAVVSLFMTALFGRNLDHDRPHLMPGLAWAPAVRRSRLNSLARLIVPYRSIDAIDRGVAMTHDVLQATVQLARSRGATPLIVVPQLGPEDPAEVALRRRVLGDTLPYLLVTVDAAWRLPWDRHPNARADHLIAAAIARRLQGR
jgi:hypothetical protein